MATKLPSPKNYEQEIPQDAGAEVGRTDELANGSHPSSSLENRASRNEEDIEKTSKPEDEHEYVTGIKLVLIMVPITLVYFLLMLDGSIISTAIPEITSQFDSLLDVGWYVV